jgi:ABC-type antimicrobial peptide transport system permease subunit
MDFEYIPGYYWFDCDDSETTKTVIDDCSDRYGDHIVSTMNFDEILEGSMTTFKGLAAMMLVFICAVSAALILLVLYLLIKAFIFSKRKDYGIYKAIGYTSNSLILQTALSFMPSIIVSAAVFSVVSYFAANPYMNLIMMFFGIVKSNFIIPIPGLAAIALGVIVISFIFAMFEARKIKNIEAYNMLLAE